MEEIKFWQGRLLRIAELYAQTQKSDFKECLEYLREQTSHYHPALQTCLVRLEELQGDVKTTIKWLEPLTLYFDALHTSGFSEILKQNTIPKTFHLLSLLWVHNERYPTCERMTSLIAGIVEDIINHAASYISMDLYFVPDPTEVASRINTVFHLCSLLKTSFYTFRNKALTLSTKIWRTSSQQIFAHCDQVLERCNDILDIIEARNLFAWLGKVDTGAFEGRDFRESIETVCTSFQVELLKYAQEASPYIVSRTGEFEAFTKENFMKIIHDLEERVAVDFLDHVERSPMDVALARRVVSFQRLLSQPMLAACQKRVLCLFWKRWGDEIRAVQRIHGARDDALEEPSKARLVVKNLATFRRLYDLQEETRKVSDYAAVEAESDEMHEAILLYNATCQRIGSAFEASFRSWSDSLLPCLAKLDLSVLQYDVCAHRYFVVLDDELRMVLRETGMVVAVLSQSVIKEVFPASQIPHAAHLILQLKMTLWQRYTSLHTATENFNDLSQTLQTFELQLLAEEIRTAEVLFARGAADVVWSNSAAVDAFAKELAACVERIATGARCLKQHVESVLHVIDKGGNAETPLFPLLTCRIGDKTMPLDDFRKKYHQHTMQWTESIGEMVALRSKLSENALSDLNTLKTSWCVSPVSAGSSEWCSFLSSVDIYLSKSLITSSEEVLRRLSQQLDPSWVKLNEGMPLLEARLSVGTSSLVLIPDFTQEIVMTLSQVKSDPQRIITSSQFQVAHKEGELSCLGQMESIVGLSLQQSAKALSSFISSLHHLEPLWSEEVQAELKRELFQGSFPVFGLPVSEIRDRMKTIDTLTETIQDLPNYQVVSGWLRVDMRGIKQSLKQLSQQMQRFFSDHLYTCSRRALAETRENIAKTTQRFESDLVGKDDSEGVKSLFELLRTTRKRNEATKAMFLPISHAVRLLQSRNSFTKEELEVITEESEHLEPQWEQLHNRSLAIREQLSSTQDREVAALKQQCAAFAQKINTERKKLLQSIVFTGSASNYKQQGKQNPYAAMDVARAMWNQLETENNALTQLGALYDMQSTQVVDIQRTMEDLQLAKLLWDTAAVVGSTLDKWMTTPFSSVDPNLLSDEARKFAGTYAAMPLNVRLWGTFVSAEQEIQNLIVSLPLVVALRSKAMRSRHWDELAQLFITSSDVAIDPQTSSFSLGVLLSFGLHQQPDAVHKIVERAEKELVIESSLSRIGDFWDDTRLPTAAAADDPQILILGPIQEIIEIVDEHISSLQSVLTSRWVEFFRVKAQRCLSSLHIVESVLSLWWETQKLWSSLFAIFMRSADLRLALAEDAAAFDVASASFCAVCAAVLKCPRPVAEVLADNSILADLPGKSENLHDRLEVVHDTLQKCEKSLAKYLELKRRSFPRFFFVSNADLVDIQSHANSPQAVCNHINKIISSVAECVFGSESQSDRIIGLTSVEGELLRLTSPVDCRNKPVEDWLGELLDSMRNGVKTAFVEANIAYSEVQRTEWMFNHICQAVTVISRAHWTAETTTALEQLENGSLSAVADHLQLLRNQLVLTIETVLKPLTPLQRKTVISLITLDVHARDIVSDLLEKNVDTTAAFAWQSQLRLLFFGETNDADNFTQFKECRVMICDTYFLYGLEYIGNCGCLVVTPLTDRCYITLTQALKLHCGGAPAGPAGTGKTETVKDIARAIGIPVYVFNCSDQMDFYTVGSIIKGLSMSGSWGCFDEFNRIAVEVLSVIATQVRSVLEALRMGQPTFSMFGDDLPVKSTVGIFITMNPGYKGRTELPENVKSLFRPCAMVVPDIAYICEILLSAEGFISSKELARKFVRLFQLNADVLSPQNHYDWGLRAIRAVLFIAGSLRRSSPQEDEASLLLRALRDANLAKLVSGDVDMFSRLLDALFPQARKLETFNTNLAVCFKDAAEEGAFSLGEDSGILNKGLQLYDLLQVRHSLCIVGATGCGKSTLLQLTRDSIENCVGRRIFVETMDPKAVTAAELYGYVNQLTREWKDGVLSRCFRDFSSNPRFKGGFQWIVLDGEIDADWIESMNSVMDENKLLTLANNERIVMTPTMRLLFEVTHLRNATMATVSRTGILYINNGDVPWTAMKDRWLAFQQPQDRISLDMLFEKHTQKFLEIVEALRHILPMNRVALLRRLCFMLEAILSRPELHPVNLNAVAGAYEKLFVFACINSFGGLLLSSGSSHDDRSIFSASVRKQFVFLRIPEAGTVFDYGLKANAEKGELEWAPWSSMFPASVPFTISAETPLCNAILPHTDLNRQAYFMKLLVGCKKHVLLVGPSGCGKSHIVKHFVRNELRSADMVNEGGELAHETVHFTVYTDSMSLQNRLDRMLEKRTGRQFGPCERKKLIVVLENVNFCATDKYGSQSAHALLRQFINHGFWYDRQKLSVKEIVDMQFVASFSTTHSQQPLTERLAHRLYALGVETPSTASAVDVFVALSRAYLTTRNIREGLQKRIAVAVQSAVECLDHISKTNLPSAVNFHYHFTLRDVQRLCQGLVSIDNSTHESMIPSMWHYEACCVFADRMSTLASSSKCSHELATRARNSFMGSSGVDRIGDFLFVPFVRCCEQNDGTLPFLSSYGTAPDTAKAVSEIHQRLKSRKSATSLVLFEQATALVMRISRILCLPSMSVTLAGAGGSGKRSLARLAIELSHFNEFKLLNEDIKVDFTQLLKECVLRDRRVCVIVSEADHNFAGILPLVDELLATRFLDCLLADDKEELIAKMASQLRFQGMSNDQESCADALRAKISQNLRFLICISVPTLKTLQRGFGGISETQLIFFHDWPAQALKSVARQLLVSDEPYFGFDSKVAFDNVCEFLAKAHSSTERQCRVLQTQEYRETYVTAKSFLCLLELAAKVIVARRTEMCTTKQRLSTGVQKLVDCGDRVESLQVELGKFKVALTEKAAHVAVLIEKVNYDKSIVEEQNGVAMLEEAKTNKIVQEVDSLVSDCAADLNAAQPIVQAARAALNTLNRPNLTELKAMGCPPPDVQHVAACVMCLISPGNRIPRDRSWASARRMMQDVPRWMKQLEDLDVNNIPQECVDACIDVVEQPFFNPDNIRSKSFAAASLCGWVVNVVKYHHIRVMVRPKEQRLAEAEQRLVVSKAHLRKVQDKVALLTGKLNALIFQYEEAKREKLHCQDQLVLTEKKLERAQRLLISLGGEKQRWQQGLATADVDTTFLDGDSLFAAAFTAYCGPFPAEHRKMLTATWIKDLEAHSIPHSETIDPVSALFPSFEDATWRNEGLAAAVSMTHNAAMSLSSLRWPILIDPQHQAMNWLTGRCKRLDRSLALLRTQDLDFAAKLVSAVRSGEFVVLEDNSCLIPPIMKQLMERSYTPGPGGVQFVKLGATEVVLNPCFSLMIVNNLANPKFEPDIFAQCTVINFCVTEMALQEQLLSIVVSIEKPDLESNRIALVRQMNDMTVGLRDCESLLLAELSTASGDILENEKLISTLETTKTKSEQLEIALEQAKLTKVKIVEALSLYLPISERGAAIYMCLVELAKVDSLYFYSIDLFQRQYELAVSDARHDPHSPDRIAQLESVVTRSLYRFADRSIFAAHKIIFAMMVSLSILVRKHLVPEAHMLLFLRGGRVATHRVPTGASEWLSHKTWEELLSLADIEGTNPALRLLPEDCCDTSRWRQWCEQPRPENERMPGDWKLLPFFYRLLIIKVLRPDRVMSACKQFVCEVLGKFVVEDSEVALEKLLPHVPRRNPVLFVLSTGTDVERRLVESMQHGKITAALTTVSMGQNQEQRAIQAIQHGVAEGGWVLLENIHLMKTWLGVLEQRVQALGETHKDFRLFLSAEPVDHMSSGLLQGCVKIVFESPQGVKSNFLKAYQLFASEPWEQSTKPHEYHVLVYGLCFFHAVVVERARFGPAGWNRRYPFTLEDLQACTNTLATYLEDRPRVPWEDIRFMCGEIIYGGHVTDMWDRRLVKTYLSTFLSPQTSEGGEVMPGVIIPSSRNHQETIQLIEETFPDETPSLFSMSAVSEIRVRSVEGRKLLETLLDIFGSKSTSVQGEETRTLDVTSTLLGLLPEEIALDNLRERFGEDRTPFHHVFFQECERMNRLTAVVHDTLELVEAAARGHSPMTAELESVIADFLLDRIPAKWLAFAARTKRSLGSWMMLVNEGGRQLLQWTNDLMTPRVVNLSTFFVPIAFITAVLHDSALKTGEDLDQMSLVVEITKRNAQRIDMHAREGCYVNGPWLEGATWDASMQSLQDAHLRDGMQLPVMILRAVPAAKLDRSDMFKCPLYATTDRSETFITTMHLRTRLPVSTWVLRGTALILDGA